MKHYALLLLGIVAASPNDAPLWRDVTAENLPPKDSVGRNSMDVEAADFDGDGDLDLFVAEEFLPNKILRNEGGGRFVDESNLLPPLETERLGQGPKGHDSEDVSVADFDGDGRLDLVFVSEDDVKLGRKNVHEYYRGTAEGGFVRVFDALPDSEANAVAHADLNGDGRPELFLSGAGQDLLLINDGKGGFQDESGARLPREAATGQDAEFCDVDGDGDFDLVLALEGGHALWTNDGKAHYVDETRERLPWIGALVEARKVTPADVDGDGDLDLYFAHVGWQGREPQDVLYLNDGKGVFGDVTSAWLPVERETTADAKFADLDGDGDLDLVRANLGPLSVWENAGAKFVDVSSKFLAEEIVAQQLALELADFDGDGAIDLYLGCLAGPNKDARSFDRLFLGAKP
ncbi:MAG: hypothetical protein GC161_15650 [Planctomycetaceae bacterium]|nr:hypothetical protein [Planctomycetaceae bacterium]